MTELAACLVAAGHDLSVIDYSAADTGSECYGNEELSALSDAGNRFAESGAIGVIFKVDFCVNKLVYKLDRRDLIKIKIVCIFNNAFLFVDVSGSSDSDAFNFVKADSGI